MCTMHKLGLQVWPSPDVMVLMSRGTLCKMAMLSTALEDALAYCTVQEFAAGFKTVPGFPDQVLVRRGHLDHRAECWQPLPHIHRDGVAILSMCLRAYYMVEEFAGGFKKRLALQLRGIKQNRGSSCECIWITKRQPGSRRDEVYGIEGVCVWLQEDDGLPASRHQAEQMLVRRRHLDHQIWQLMHFIRRGAVHGLEGHMVQGGIHHRRGACIWLQEDVGFPTARHQANQRLVRRGRLDNPTKTWQPCHCKSYREGRGTDDEGFVLMTLTPLSCSF